MKCLIKNYINCTSEFDCGHEPFKLSPKIVLPCKKVYLQVGKIMGDLEIHKKIRMATTKI